jgi:hypothetical protein
VSCDEEKQVLSPPIEGISKLRKATSRQDILHRSCQEGIWKRVGSKIDAGASREQELRVPKKGLEAIDYSSRSCHSCMHDAFGKPQKIMAETHSAAPTRMRTRTRARRLRRHSRSHSPVYLHSTFDSSGVLHGTPVKERCTERILMTLFPRLCP